MGHNRYDMWLEMLFLSHNIDVSVPADKKGMQITIILHYVSQKSSVRNVFAMY